MQLESDNPLEATAQLTSGKLRRALFAVAILSTCGLIMSMDFADPDLWGHVQYGREIIQDGVLPETATWTFTSVGTRWVNHENIAELVMAFAVDTFGPWGLTFGKYLFGWILLGIIWWRARAAGVSQFVVAVVCLTVAFTVEFHWHFRPQIFGYVLFGMMTVLLHWCFSGMDKQPVEPRRLWHLFWLVPLIAVWANTHGSFAAGLCIAIAYLGLRFCELCFALYRRSPESKSSTIAIRKSLFLLPAVVVGMCLATLLTPYGVELHQWLWGALHEARPEIGDWESPSLFSLSPEVIGFWVIMLTSALTLKSRQGRNWVNIVVLLLIALQAASHIRHLPLLAILWASLFTEDIDHVWKKFVADAQHRQKEASQRTGHSPVKSGVWNRSKVVLSLLVIWISAVGMATWPRLATLNVPRDRYPVDALKFLADNQLEGRTVVTFNWAQYAIGFFANEKLDSTVAIDGRFRTCYSQEVIDIYFDFIFGKNYSGPRNRSSESGPVNANRALTYQDPDLFLVSRKQQSTMRVLEENRDSWVLLYQDGLAQVWGKRTRFGDPESSDFVADDCRLIGTETVHAAAPWPAFASKSQQHSAHDQLAVQP